MKLELRAIRVKNCGPLDDVRVEFYDEQGKTLPVCVLAGANGSGKTTILKTIEWAIQKLGENTWRWRGDLPSFDFVQLEFLLDGSAFSVAFGAKPNDVTLSAESLFFAWADDRKAWLTRQQEGGKLVRKLIVAIQQQQQTGKELSGFAKSSLNGDQPPTILCFPHSRHLLKVAGEQVNKEVLPYEFVHRFDVVGAFPGSLSSYLIWLDYADSEQFKSAQEFLNELDFEGKTFHVQRKTLDVMVRTRDGHEHKLHELSSGEQNLLILLMELRRRLLPHSIVLIDEVENSLHPAYQHKLAQALLKMQQMIPFQLIVTTHSWEIAEIFGTSATRVLTKF